jgi:hypothetical protein
MIKRGEVQGMAWPRRRETLIVQMCTTALLPIAIASACGSRDVARDTALEDGTAEIAVLHSDSLFEAVDAFVASNGHIWVLSRYEPFVHVFDKDGSFIRAFGRHGQGPNELRAPHNFAGEVSDSNIVEIWDGGRRQVVRLTPDGEMVGTIDLPVGEGHILGDFRRVFFGEPGQALRVADGYVLDTYEKHVRVPNDVWPGSLTFSGSSGETRGAVLLADPPRDRSNTPVFEIYEPIPLWSVCPDGRVAILNPPGMEVRWSDARGTILTRDTLRIEDVQITEKDIERYVRLRLSALGRDANQPIDTSSPAARRQTAQTVADLVTYLPRTAPPVRARCDAYNRLWIQQFATESDARGYGAHWLLLEASSNTTEVRFSRGFVPLHFGRGMIVGIHTDSLDAARAAYATYPRN